MVSFLIMMINVEQVLTACQVLTGQAREGPSQEGTAQSCCSAPSESQASCVVPVRQGADKPQNYRVWRRTEDTAGIIHLRGGVSFHPAPGTWVSLSVARGSGVSSAFSSSVVFWAHYVVVTLVLPLALEASGGLCSRLSSSHVPSAQVLCGTDSATMLLDEDFQSELPSWQWRGGTWATRELQGVRADCRAHWPGEGRALG